MRQFGNEFIVPKKRAKKMRTRREWSKTNHRVVRALIDFGLGQSGAWRRQRGCSVGVLLFFYILILLFPLLFPLFEQRKDFGQRVVHSANSMVASYTIPCIKKKSLNRDCVVAETSEFERGRVRRERDVASIHGFGYNGE